MQVASITLKSEWCARLGATVGSGYQHSYQLSYIKMMIVSEEYQLN